MNKFPCMSLKFFFALLNCTPDAHLMAPKPLMVQKNCVSTAHYKCRKNSFNFMVFCLLFYLCRRYGTKCSGCGQGIAPSDLVRKPRDKVFHLNCFTCCICRKQLSTGEQLYVLDDNKFICKDDYMLGKGPHHHMTGEFEKKKSFCAWKFRILFTATTK